MYHLMFRKVWRKLLFNIETRILEGDSFTFHHVRGDVTGGRDEMKNTSYFPLYWLVNTDPDIGFL